MAPVGNTPAAATGSAEQALAAKRDELLDQMATLEKPPSEQGSISFGKRVGEGTSMAVDRLSAVAVHEALQVSLADVDRALAKVAEGSYGACDVCGQPIGPGRLEVRPWATLCVTHASAR